ncbi:hypothetical protein BC830DRAFT_1118060 [Chytriomyces sp. MP71]|nr:hypothetical protein BC830DRAFT_1118060 [Chytriomyces sp. MP71]
MQPSPTDFIPPQTSTLNVGSMVMPATTFREISLAALPIEEVPLTKDQMVILQRRRESMKLGQGLPQPLPDKPLASSSTSGSSESYVLSPTAPIVGSCENKNAIQFTPRSSTKTNWNLTVDTGKLNEYRATTEIQSGSTASSASPTFATSADSSSSQSPQSHKQKVNGERRHSYTHVYKCPIEGCNQSFHKAMNLHSHINTHDSSKVFTCPDAECGAMFRRSHDLRRHYLSMHNEQGRQFLCLKCPKRFARLDALKRHVSRPGNKCFIDLGEEGCMARLAALVRDDMQKRGLCFDNVALSFVGTPTANSQQSPASKSRRGSKVAGKKGLDGVLTVAALGGLQSPDDARAAMKGSLESFMELDSGQTF